MKRIIYTFFMVLCLSSVILGQEKIGQKIFLYGDLENTIKGKTLINYNVDDPKGMLKILKRFKKNAIDVILWDKLFLPGYEYSNSEINEVIERKGIETFIFIKVVDTSYYNESYAITNYNTTYAASESVVGSVSLVFEIYSVRDKFEKPLAVIKGEAGNIWGSEGSQRGVVLKIINRILKAMKKEKAF